MKAKLLSLLKPALVVLLIASVLGGAAYGVSKIQLPVYRLIFISFDLEGKIVPTGMRIVDQVRHRQDGAICAHDVQEDSNLCIKTPGYILREITSQDQ